MEQLQAGRKRLLWGLLDGELFVSEGTIGNWAKVEAPKLKMVSVGPYGNIAGLTEDGSVYDSLTTDAVLDYNYEDYRSESDFENETGPWYLLDSNMATIVESIDDGTLYAIDFYGLWFYSDELKQFNSMEKEKDYLIVFKYFSSCCENSIFGIIGNEVIQRVGDEF